MSNQSPGPGPLGQYQWQPQPAGQRLVTGLLDEFLGSCPPASELAAGMRDRAGTRFSDWVDHISVPASDGLRARLREAGFALRPQRGAPEAYTHEGAIFPWIRLSPGNVTRVAIKVDSVVDFLATWRLEHDIEGDPFSRYRAAPAFWGANAELWVVERHGDRGFDPVPPDPEREFRAVRHLELFRRRKRDFGVGPHADRAGYDHAEELIEAAVADLGQDWACDLFFQAERDCWQRRNRAARVQKARQDALGLGWANHDHHTYRSGRAAYPRLIAMLERLGFVCRERFYAGHEAYWGAQVLGQPATGITVFADVDMTPEELMGDFAHEGFATDLAGGELGTIGLWCRLHGEAFLQAGLHHLECQFDWWALKDQLEREANVSMMDPFTTFPHLRQCFTSGERWPVDPRRIEALLADGLIDPDQAREFREHGAVGSHLENLERNDGFKGFNQQGVSDIISRTDPRKLRVVHAGA